MCAIDVSSAERMNPSYQPTAVTNPVNQQNPVQGQQIPQGSSTSNGTQRVQQAHEEDEFEDFDDHGMPQCKILATDLSIIVYRLCLPDFHNNMQSPLRVLLLCIIICCYHFAHHDPYWATACESFTYFNSANDLS